MESAFGRQPSGEDWLLREPDAVGGTGCQIDRDDDEDDFEKEMSAELEERIQRAEQDGGLRADCGDTRSTRPKKSQKPELMDSDEEEEGEKMPQPSNDDLLFDPGADNEDQKWADTVRRSHQPKTGGLAKAPNSSAVLSCPACFQVVCIDCQQHWEYKHQFRAMFVMNCSVDTSSSLTFPLTKREQKRLAHQKKKQKETSSFNSDEPDEVFKAVKCNECSTQIAVYDSDEVYHFFNVLASQS